MMVYKDRQFCTSSKCSEFGKCWRSFTPREEANAERWWKTFDLPDIPAPIDKRSYENEDCYNPKMDK
jgi:hypothetical protein